MLEEVKKFVNESLKNETEHFERTLYWTKQLDPGADESTMIAAYAHDLGRSVRKTTSEETFKEKELNDPEILKERQERGAEVIFEFLKRLKFPEEKIKRIVNMVKKHEVGGYKESNLIKDADSISYFEVYAIKHAEKLAPVLGKEKMKRKFDWMFERITSEKAKEIAEPFYEKAVSELEK